MFASKSDSKNRFFFIAAVLMITIVLIFMFLFMFLSEGVSNIFGQTVPSNGHEPSNGSKPGYGGPTPKVVGGIKIDLGGGAWSVHEIQAFDASSVGGTDWGNWYAYDWDGWWYVIEINQVVPQNESTILVEGVIVDTNRDGFLGIGVPASYFDAGPGVKGDMVGPYNVIEGNIVVKTYGMFD
jgi:hypothetical protein